MEYPLQSLQESRWFKLICGASFQHLPAVRSLTLAYGLAGADCIDVAADPAVVSVARDGIRALQSFQRGRPVFTADFPGFLSEPSAGPWLMVSLNDGDDPHFRKAKFDPQFCPSDCDRPCQAICPTQAIVFGEVGNMVASHRATLDLSEVYQPSGVIQERCYGCGRCVQICPVGQIDTASYTVPAGAIAPDLFPLVDAIEIHTQVGRTTAFERLWQQIYPHIYSLKLIAVSCPDGEGFVEYLRTLHGIMTAAGSTPLPCPVLWQTDGRPMSGDIGKGTTHAAIRLAQRAIAADLPGFIQLAGGTNAYTVPRLRSLGLLPHHTLAGVAYGSYARKILAPVLGRLDQQPSSHPPLLLESCPELLREAVQSARSLVSQIKSSSASAVPHGGWKDGTGHHPSSTLNPV